jgi:hypothetical protein
MGYLPGRDPEDDGTWIVDRSAAHAWVEVYFPEYGWVEFDPTPGNGENGGDTPTVLPLGEEVPPGTPRPSVDPFPGGGETECIDPFDTPPCEEDGPVLPGPTTPAPPTDVGLGPIALMAALILGLAGLALLFAYRRRVPTTEPELAYRGVTSLAARLGYGPRPSQTAYEFAAGLGELVPVAQEDLHLIATAKVEATYGRRTAGENLLRRLGLAYRRARLGMLRLIVRRPKLGLKRRLPRGSGS